MNASHSVADYAEVNGARLYYEIGGSGRPLVLIHAGIADARMWDAQWQTFLREFRVVRYDMRGFGRSTIPPAPFAHHDDLAALLRYLDIPTCTLVGSSYGGNVATAFALEHPESVGALVLVNSLVGMTEPSAGLRAGWDATEEKVEAGDLAGGVEIELQMWVDGPHRSPGQVDSGVREQVRAMNIGLFQRIEEQEAADEEGLDPPARERLGEIRAPTLVIVGELDQPDALASADAVVKAVPDARKAVIPDAAHLPSMERPAEFNQTLRDFIRGL